MSSPGNENAAYIIAFNVLVMIVGVFGNIFVIIIFKKNKTLRNPLSIPVANLAVVDVLQSCMGITFTLSVSEGKQVIGNRLCQLEAFLTSTFVVVSTWTLLLISANRYIKICRPKLEFLVNKKNTIVGITFSWTWGVIMAVAPLFGWSSYGYDPRQYVCTTIRMQASYIATFMFTVVLGPFVGICFSYLQVFRYIRKKRNGMSTLVMNGRARHQERNLSVMLGIVVASYFCFYAPITSMYIYETVTGRTIPRAYRLATLLIVFMNSANNPIVYGLMNRNFRNAFLKLLRKGGSTVRILPSSQRMRLVLRGNHQQQQQQHQQQQQQQQQTQQQPTTLLTTRKSNHIIIKEAATEDSNLESEHRTEIAQTHNEIYLEKIESSTAK